MLLIALSYLAALRTAVTTVRPSDPETTLRAELDARVVTIVFYLYVN